MGKTKAKKARVQIDRRQDGTFSVTVKLLEWKLNELRGLVSMLYLNPMSRHIAVELGPALEKAKIPATVEEEEDADVPVH